MRTKIIAFLFMFLVVLNFALVVRAQDDVLQVEDAPLGPYQISVWISPHPAQVGKLHIRALLTPVAAEEFATAPTITAHAQALHTDVFSREMTLQSSTYTTDFDIPYAGPWNLKLVVKNGDWEDAITIPLEIQPAPIDKNMIRLAAFATLMVLLIGWWFWGRKPRKKRVRKRIFMPRPDDVDR